MVVGRRTIMAAGINEFLEKYKLLVDVSEYKEECSRFIYEMTLGLAYKDRGLPMVHTYISDEGKIPIGEKIVVVDAGGTNLRVATVHFDEQLTPIISNYNRYSMPGVTSEISADELFTQIAELLIPYLINCNKVGICFSYMSESTVDRDAKVVELSKEVKVRDIKGRMVCREIAKVLESRGITGKRFTLVNDSVATLLAGKITSNTSDEHIGYILGTGQNICYSEKIENILRLEMENTNISSMIINVESGYYNRYDRGSLDVKLDEESENTSSHILEKMMSGAYLGNITLRVLKAAASEGLLSREAKKRLNELQELPLVYVDEYYSDSHSSNIFAQCFSFGETDITVSRSLIDAVMRRAAYLNAVVIGATLKKAEAGMNNENPCVICIDGTTFYKTLWLKQHIDELFKTLIEEGLQRKFITVKVEDAPLIGTAVAGLT